MICVLVLDMPMIRTKPILSAAAAYVLSICRFQVIIRSSLTSWARTACATTKLLTCVLARILCLPSQFAVQLTRFGAVGQRVHKNLKKFMNGKKKNEDVFDRINPTLLNRELTQLMPGLSAKVFRTYNASITLERELADLDPEIPWREKVSD